MRASRRRSKLARLEARLTPEHKAHRTIEGTQIIRLSVEDQRTFVEAILNPPPLTPAMERAIESNGTARSSRHPLTEPLHRLFLRRSRPRPVFREPVTQDVRRRVNGL
jgi:uncharacterized protein (DUF1778 family)